MSHAETQGEVHANFDEQGHLISDLPCVDCGYNLRTLTVDAMCPECGSAVKMSADRHYLADGDLSWLKSIRKGTRLIIAMPLISVLGSILFVILFALSGESIGSSQMIISAGAGIISLLWDLGIKVLWVLSFWWFTTPEPNREERLFWTARRLVRWTSVYAMMIQIGTMLLTAVLTQIDGPVGGLWMLSGSVVFSAMVALIGTLALIRYLGALALRVPAPKLASFSRNLFRLAIFVISMAIASVVVLWVESSSGVVNAMFTVQPGNAAGVGAAGMRAAGVGVPGVAFTFVHMLGGCSAGIIVIAMYVYLVLIYRNLTRIIRWLETQRV